MMYTHYVSSIYVVLLAALLLAGCSQPKVTPPTTTPQPVIPLTSTPTASPVLTSTPTSLPTYTAEPTRTPLPPTPTPELLTCQAPSQQAEAVRPVKLLYANGGRVWMWDEASGQKTQVSLPDDASAPQISEDGRSVAFLKQGQAYDTADQPAETIPLWLFDRKSGQARQVASFDTTETRHLYPDARQIQLHLEWLPDGHWLLVQVYFVVWGDTIFQPTGDLFLVNADAGLRQRVLKGGEYVRYSISPDGKQIAALGTGALSSDGTWNDAAVQDGALYLINVPPEDGIQHLRLRLAKNIWSFFTLVYSPNSAHIALQVETGIAVIDTQSGQIQQVPLENPCPAAGCTYGGGLLNAIWQPDGKSFYTLTSQNDYFDTRAEGTLRLIRLEPALTTETVQDIQTGFISFSPDGRILWYFNQTGLEAPEETMNWVTLYIMNLQKGQPRRYTAEFSLRVINWSPDSQHFLYFYSPFGGPNQITDRLALGSICQPPSGLTVPEGTLIHEARWLDPTRFLAWTLPSDGIPDRYTTGLYLYSLAIDSQPVHIDDQLQDQLEPYLTQTQVVVLEK